jgi:hypothetical protein
MFKKELCWLTGKRKAAAIKPGKEGGLRRLEANHRKALGEFSGKKITISLKVDK